jgi:hypothetical protein
MSELSVGDSVLTMTPRGSLQFSPVLMFIDSKPATDDSSRRTFVEILTSSGRKMSLTPSHLVYVVDEVTEEEKKGFFDEKVPFESNNEVDVEEKHPKNVRHNTATEIKTRSARAIFARDVVPGMSVLVAESRDAPVISEKVVSAVPVLGTTGFYAPLTSVGTVVVDDVVASCYAVVEDQYLAHWAFWPVRSYYGVKNWFFPPTASNSTPRTLDNSAQNSTETTVDPSPSSSGIHWYAKMLYSLAEYLLPERMLYERQR